MLFVFEILGQDEMDDDDTIDTANHEGGARVLSQGLVHESEPFVPLDPYGHTRHQTIGRTPQVDTIPSHPCIETGAALAGAAVGTGLGLVAAGLNGTQVMTLDGFGVNLEARSGLSFTVHVREGARPRRDT